MRHPPRRESRMRQTTNSTMQQDVHAPGPRRARPASSARSREFLVPVGTTNSKPTLIVSPTGRRTSLAKRGQATELEARILRPACMSSRKRARSHFELKMAPRRTKRLAEGTIPVMQKPDFAVPFDRTIGGRTAKFKAEARAQYCTYKRKQPPTHCHQARTRASPSRYISAPGIQFMMNSISLNSDLGLKCRLGTSRSTHGGPAGPPGPPRPHGPPGARTNVKHIQR